MKSFTTPFATLAAFSLGISSLWSFDKTHAGLTKIISTTVVESGVKYPELKKQHSALKDYLTELALVKESEFKKWKEADQLSFLINLYNASTLNVVLEHYPIKSFKDEVGGKEGPWKIPSVNLFGKLISLDELEHKSIRENYNEPRIHFALNCASAGCPPLRDEAYTAKQLEKQLNEQTKAFLADTKANKLSGKKLELSPIFDWFKDDFIKKSGSVEAFVNPYFSQKISKGSVSISYTNYGWTLNEAK